MSDGAVINNHAAFIWSVADLLRGDYKQSEYGKVVLPLTVLRRLDCVLEPVKDDMLARHAQVKDTVDNFGPILDRLTDIKNLWNISRFDLPKLLDDPGQLADNLRAYVAGFSPQVRDIIEQFDLDAQITRLDRSNLLYKVLGKFAEIDLHPDTVSNIEMGYLYEELIRRFSELSNETAGEHFTPREVIRLMVNLLFIEDDDLLAKPGIAKTLFDPACGTGGMLSVAEDHLRQLNPSAQLQVYGQELNPETYAICRSDMMLKGQNAENIAYGNSFSEDGHPGRRFDYLLANPPFGVEWKKVKDEVQDEHDSKGFAGRFGAGLPRINDGSFLFLQHMISKMKRPEEGGARLAIVFNGSPLVTGAAGSGESEIRRWIIENDWLEAVVALPDQLFYNTGISTYFWIVTNRKSPERRGKVQLIDARESFTKMRKSLGEKRKQFAEEQMADIVRLYGAFEQGERCKIFDNEAFGFLRITVERPLRQRWEITDGGIEALRADKKFAKLDETAQASIISDLGHHLGSSEDDHAIRDLARTAMRRADVKGKPIENAIVDAFAITDPEASIVADPKGGSKPDPDLRDNENVPLAVDTIGRVVYERDPTGRLATGAYRELVAQYLDDEVLPYVPDAWVDHDKTKIGYEIPLTRHFYTYTPPRPLDEIDAEIKALEAEIQALLAEVTE
ncbi:MAG: N-6 DNA methylase [Acidimicrobiales bacterium]